MDVNHATMQQPAHTGDHASADRRLNGVFSMDDFLSSSEADHAARKAAKITKAAQQKATASKSNNAAPEPGAGPVAVGARSSKHTIALHEKYQALGIPIPSFTYGGSSDQGWHGEVSFPGLDVPELQGIKDDTIHSSKQEAKEGLSERAMEILTRLEKEGRVKKMDAETRARSSKYKVALHDKHQKLGIPKPFFTHTGSSTQGWTAEVSFPGLEVDGFQGKTMKNETPYPSKQDASEALSKQVLELVEIAEKEGKFEKYGRVKGPAQVEPQEKPEPGPNYLGQLLEFQRATAAPQPTYTDYRVGGALFACQVTIDDGVSPQVFGSLDSHYTSKKRARQEAARVAVEHFKSQGTWPSAFSEVGGIKKKKKTQPSDDLELLTPATKPASESTSYAQQVARLAIMLSLGTPEWRFTPSPLDRDFHTVACYFAGGGEHAGPIGEVRNVFGKKKAKEESARLTLDYLNELHAHRINFGKLMMEGIVGADEVVQGAAGKAVEGEREAVEARASASEGSEGEVDEGFEDAVEMQE